MQASEYLEDYIAAHTSPEPEHLTRLYRHTYLRHLYPRMCSGHVQGRLLAMLTTMIRPQRVLEIGTFTGYATLCLAEGLPPEGEIHTVEINDEMEDELTQLFATTPGGDRITLHIGDALEVVAQLDALAPWDLVLIDANKRLYPQYLELILPRLKSGGYILADNTLWDGKVMENPLHLDPQMQGIMTFNDMVAANPQLEVVMLPVRDGLSIIRKRP
ncbi:MAG: O-methyltransferase [Bacteroidales bacterium]|nr:O-methyltransferase [Bacteroidales bacterium]